MAMLRSSLFRYRNQFLRNTSTASVTSRTGTSFSTSIGKATIPSISPSSGNLSNSLPLSSVRRITRFSSSNDTISGLSNSYRTAEWLNIIGYNEIIEDL